MEWGQIGRRYSRWALCEGVRILYRRIGSPVSKFKVGLDGKPPSASSLLHSFGLAWMLIGEMTTPAARSPIISEFPTLCFWPERERESFPFTPNFHTHTPARERKREKFAKIDAGSTQRWSPSLFRDDASQSTGLRCV